MLSLFTSGVCCDYFNWKISTFLISTVAVATVQKLPQTFKSERYWVEMRWTIMSMMREPRGQVQRSMLGLLILSSSSWSSSQRSLFTSSATWSKTI